jgi:sulfate/thiosulfate transport system substrate-binding protein
VDVQWNSADLGRFRRKDQVITIELAFRGWNKAHAEHFAEGGTFEQFYKPDGKSVTL